MDYKEIIKARINILPEQLRIFVVDENWRREAEKISKQFSFDEEKYTAFENEIFLTLLCFEPISDFTENLKTALEIDSNMADWVTEDVKKQIFNNVADEIKAIWQNMAKEETQSSSEVESGDSAGTDFEQIILNQAKAMMPARNALASEAGGPVQDSGQQSASSSQVPENLPTEQEKPANLPTGDSEPRVIHNYITEPDPYREPVE